MTDGGLQALIDAQYQRSVGEVRALIALMDSRGFGDAQAQTKANRAAVFANVFFEDIDLLRRSV